jgi:hypothetical protein
VAEPTDRLLEPKEGRGHRAVSPHSLELELFHLIGTASLRTLLLSPLLGESGMGPVEAGRVGLVRVLELALPLSLGIERLGRVRMVGLGQTVRLIRRERRVEAWPPRPLAEKDASVPVASGTLVVLVDPLAASEDELDPALADQAVSFSSFGAPSQDADRAEVLDVDLIPLEMTTTLKLVIVRRVDRLGRVRSRVELDRRVGRRRAEWRTAVDGSMLGDLWGVRVGRRTRRARVARVPTLAVALASSAEAIAVVLPKVVVSVVRCELLSGADRALGLVRHGATVGRQELAVRVTVVLQDRRKVGDSQ